MPGKDIITMSVEELKRLNIIHKLQEKKISQQKASELLELCVRQVRRVLNRVIEEGDTGVIHKSRGKESNRKLLDSLKRRVLILYKNKYPDFGPTLANEKLEEIDGIKISTQTLRNWLIGEGLWEKTRKGKKHRRWRERKEYFGEMLQMDGSHHDWFEGRGPESVLMAYVDDATSNVYGKFYDYEGTFPAMDSFKGYAKQYGIAQSLYVDMHSTYKSTAKPTIEEELSNNKPMSQFERSMKELGVKVIHALSPQAKGRAERVFRTFQDRVIKEMRLKGVSSRKEGNEFLKGYLPEYNRKFECKPMKEENLHRPISKEKDIEDILCIKTKRALAKDYTVAHNKKLYQILDKVTTKHVIVEEKMDGSLLIKHNGRNLRLLEITTMPVKENQKIPCVYKSRNKYVPPRDHPWRKYSTSTQQSGHF